METTTHILSFDTMPRHQMTKKGIDDTTKMFRNIHMDGGGGGCSGWVGAKSKRNTFGE